MARLEPAAAILCDEVRREDNGKQLAIGIYGSEVIVGGFPAGLRFTLLVRLGFGGAGRESIKFRMQSEVGGQQDVSADIETAIAVKDWIAVPFQPTVLGAPTTLYFYFQDSSEQWEEIHSVPVRAGLVPIASPPQP